MSLKKQLLTLRFKICYKNAGRPNFRFVSKYCSSISSSDVTSISMFWFSSETNILVTATNVYSKFLFLSFRYSSFLGLRCPKQRGAVVWWAYLSCNKSHGAEGRGFESRLISFFFRIASLLSIWSSLEANNLEVLNVGNTYLANHAQKNGVIATSAIDHVYCSKDKMTITLSMSLTYYSG